MKKQFKAASILLIVILITMFFEIHAYAQHNKKWGKVQKKYMEMTVFPQDTTAAAVKIFDVGKMELWLKSHIDFTFSRHYQIKILKESGKKFADVVIPFWHKDKISNIKAHTILPNGKKIKLKKTQIFEEEEKKNYKLKKFTLPSIEVGSIIEVQYKLWSKYVDNLEPWIFQDQIPTIESLVTLKISPEFVYKYKIDNDPQQRIVISSEKYMNLDERRKLNMFIFKAVDLPAVRKEPYISTVKNYKARLVFQISGFRNSRVNLAFNKDMKTLCNELLDSGFELFLKPSGDVKKLVAELTRGITSESKKMRLLYAYARDHFDDESYSFGIYARKNPKKILKEQKASPSERNLLLLSMLKAAGFDTKPVLISTRNNGKITPNLPFLNQYNRTLVFVNLKDKLNLLDASDRFTPFGMLPPNSLANVGLLVEKNNPQFIRLPNTDIKSRESIQSDVHFGSQKQMRGTTKLQSIGYASRLRNRQLENEDSVEDFISSRIASDIDDFTVVKADSMLKAVAKDTFATEFEFELNELVEVIDDEIYIRPAIYSCMEKNVFVSEKREFPIEFGYKLKNTELNNIYISEGYEVVEIPENVIIANKYFTYRRVISHYDPLKLSYVRSFEITESTVPPDEYLNIKNDFARIVDADHEQIVLKVKPQAPDL